MSQKSLKTSYVLPIILIGYSAAWTLWVIRNIFRGDQDGIVISLIIALAFGIPGFNLYRQRYNNRVQLRREKAAEESLAEGIRNFNRSSAGVPANIVKPEPPKPVVSKPPLTELPFLSGYDLKYKYTIKVAGAQYHDIEDVEPGVSVELKAEPDNPYDSRAIAVVYNGMSIGYIPKNKIQDMIYDFWDKKDIVKALTYSVENGEVNLRIGFYINEAAKQARMLAKYKSKDYKLTANDNEEMQDTLFCLNAGNIIECWLDTEKERYLASVDGSDIGYFPKSANDFLNEDDYAFVKGVSENDNGKYEVVATVITGDPIDCK